MAKRSKKRARIKARPPMPELFVRADGSPLRETKLKGQCVSDAEIARAYHDLSVERGVTPTLRQLGERLDISYATVQLRLRELKLVTPVSVYLEWLRSHDEVRRRYEATLQGQSQARAARAERRRVRAKQALADLNKGLSVERVAEKHGLTPQAVEQLTKREKAKGEPKRRAFTRKEDEQIVKLFRAGERWPEIADAIGRPRSTVYKHGTKLLADLGIATPKRRGLDTSARRRVGLPPMPELPPRYEIHYYDDSSDPADNGWVIFVRGDVCDGLDPIPSRSEAISKCWSMWEEDDLDAEWSDYLDVLRDLNTAPPQSESQPEPSADELQDKVAALVNMSQAELDAWALTQAPAPSAPFVVDTSRLPKSGSTIIEDPATFRSRYIAVNGSADIDRD